MYAASSLVAVSALEDVNDDPANPVYNLAQEFTLNATLLDGVAYTTRF